MGERIIIATHRRLHRVGNNEGEAGDFRVGPLHEKKNADFTAVTLAGTLPFTKVEMKPDSYDDPVRHEG